MEKYSRTIRSKKYKKGRDKCGYEPIYILKDVKNIEAGKWDENTIQIDPRGYFLIRITEGRIEAGLVNKKNEMIAIVRGNNAVDIVHEIIKRKLISRLDHAAYMGRQLARAEYCLKNNKEFVQ
ncbi:DUF4346 domain-containing protein [Candidatus Woesearchaeota archaeon]|nr:DUF4346 domain-containing protein [Candidatus Woesearchaeota archaeon]